MARARNLKPALFKNELLGVADPLLTLLFQSLWTLADKDGRLEDRPLRIKAETFPYRDGLDVNGYLTELQRLGFIVRYVVGDLALIQVVNFKKHQTPHNTEKPSTLPPVEAGTIAGSAFQGTSVKSPLSNGENVDALPPDSLLLIPDSLNPIPEVKPDAGKPARFDPFSLELLDSIPEQAWQDWIAYRRSRKLTNNEQTVRGQLAKLIELAAAGHNPADVIRDSITNGWQGLFAPKAKQAQPKRASPHVLPPAGVGAYGESTPLPADHDPNDMTGVVY